MRLPPRHCLLVLLALTGGASCVIKVDEIAGTPCGSANDCPSGYECVPRLADGGKTCELLYPAPPADSGTQAQDAGPLRYYCTDAKPVLNTYCVSLCHGSAASGADSSQQNFQLDFYASDAGIPGAFALRDRIKVRTSDLKTMPPAGNLQPSDAERHLLAQWDLEGGLYCDGGVDGGP